MAKLLSVIRKINPLAYLKYLPHPEYGHFGGFYNRKTTWRIRADDETIIWPIDEMDSAFEDHDEGIIGSRGLIKRLLKVKNFKRPVWGRIYKWLAISYFSLPALIGRK